MLNGLRHEARHDELTGLLNRRGLDQAVERALAWPPLCRDVSSLVVIDLDGLKLVNDHAGHLAGDQMLVTLATELQTAARGVDLIGQRSVVTSSSRSCPGSLRRRRRGWAARFHERQQYGVVIRRRRAQ